MIVNKHRIMLWIERLESGTITQGREKLCYVTGEMCCLGVATELAIEHGVPLERQEGPVAAKHGKFFYYMGGENHPEEGSLGESDFLPPLVKEWLGLVDRNPDLDAADGDYIMATEANDEKHLSFAEIAEMLRRTYIDNDKPCCDGVGCPVQMPPVQPQ